MNHKVDIYDTTLRDGTQAENFNLSVEDRVRISLKLDALGLSWKTKEEIPTNLVVSGISPWQHNLDYVQSRCDYS